MIRDAVSGVEAETSSIATEAASSETLATQPIDISALLRQTAQTHH
jgi:hypothetical protein